MGVNASRRMVRIVHVIALALATHAQYTTFFSEGLDGGDIDIGREATDALFRSEGAFTRYCPWCEPSHVQLYYVRATPVPPDWSLYDTVLHTWASRNNTLNVDFYLYDNIVDMCARTNPWQYCNYDANEIGFPRDCARFQNASLVLPATMQWFSLTVCNDLTLKTEWAIFNADRVCATALPTPTGSETSSAMPTRASTATSSATTSVGVSMSTSATATVTTGSSASTSSTMLVSASPSPSATTSVASTTSASVTPSNVASSSLSSSPSSTGPARAPYCASSPIAGGWYIKTGGVVDLDIWDGGVLSKCCAVAENDCYWFSSQSECIAGLSSVSCRACPQGEVSVACPRKWVESTSPLPSVSTSPTLTRIATLTRTATGTGSATVSPSFTMSASTSPSLPASRTVTASVSVTGSSSATFTPYAYVSNGRRPFINASSTVCCGSESPCFLRIGPHQTPMFPPWGWSGFAVLVFAADWSIASTTTYHAFWADELPVFRNDLTSLANGTTLVVLTCDASSGGQDENVPTAVAAMTGVNAAGFLTWYNTPATRLSYIGVLVKGSSPLHEVGAAGDAASTTFTLPAL